MINHTMLVSFTGPIPDEQLDQFLSDIEKASFATGVLQTFAAQRHIPIPGEEEIPALIATAIVQFGVADEAALAALFASPAATEVIHTWQARYPYKVGWANHRSLA